MSHCLRALVAGLGVVACVCFTLPAFGTSNEHYPLGVEGIKAATLPPAGFYFRNYFLYYNFTDVKDKSGDDVPINPRVNLFVDAARFIWISDIQIFGGNYGADFLVPMYAMTQKIHPSGAPGDIRFSDTSVGDLYFEPITISWHGERWDAAVGGSFFAPTGHFDTVDNTPLNRGFWTGMFTFGGTYYIDEAKSISASVLGRYEIHSQQNDTQITPGNDLHLEWGVAKNIAGIDYGVAGYAHWQTTEDEGAGTNGDMDQVFAAGPEVAGMVKSVPLIDRPMMFSVRALWEFEARDRPEGFKTVLTLTFPF